MCTVCRVHQRIVGFAAVQVPQCMAVFNYFNRAHRYFNALHPGVSPGGHQQRRGAVCGGLSRAQGATGGCSLCNPVCTCSLAAESRCHMPLDPGTNKHNNKHNTGTHNYAIPGDVRLHVFPGVAAQTTAACDLTHSFLLRTHFKHTHAHAQVMRDFTSSQAALLSKGGLPLEMLAALLNNNVDAYSQSLEFTEHVQVGGAWRLQGGWCCIAHNTHQCTFKTTYVTCG